MLGIVERAIFPGSKIVLSVRFVIANKQRPAKKASLVGAVHFIVACRAAGGIGFAGIGAYFALVQVFAALVVGDAERIAAAHDVDFLSSCLLRARRSLVVGGFVVRCSFVRRGLRCY